MASYLKYVPLIGNDPADEDADIGGNEPPVSSYPPVEIEKDRISKRLSPGSCSGKGILNTSQDVVQYSMCFP